MRDVEVVRGRSGQWCRRREREKERGKEGERKEQKQVRLKNERDGK